MDGVDDRDQMLKYYWKLYKSVRLTSISKYNLLNDFLSLIQYKNPKFKKRLGNVDVAGDSCGFIKYLSYGGGT